MGWAPFTSKWAEVMPGIKPSLLISSIIHYVPIMRDVAQWFRSYEVSFTGYHNALEKHDAVVLVPGGQTEMMQSHSQQTHVVINTTHRGFIKASPRRCRMPTCPLFRFPAPVPALTIPHNPAQSRKIWPCLPPNCRHGVS